MQHNLKCKNQENNGSVNIHDALHGYNSKPMINVYIYQGNTINDEALVYLEYDSNLS